MSKPAGSAARRDAASTIIAASIRCRRADQLPPRPLLSWPANAGHPVRSDGRVRLKRIAFMLRAFARFHLGDPQYAGHDRFVVDSNDSDTTRASTADEAVRIPYVAIVACLVVVAACTAPARPKPPPPAPIAEVWPTAGWPRTTPESQGIDSNTLATALETLRARRLPVHSILVERNGYVVLDAT